jgi:hypothetical protein
MSTIQRTKEEVEILPGGDWMSSKWRPAMGWMYMAVCIFDFIIFPILWTLIQAYDHQGMVTAEWDPLTLKGGGLFHVAMGAVLGVAAWSRGQEKITAMNQGFEPLLPQYYNQNQSFSRSTDQSSYSTPTRHRNINRTVPQSEDPEL